MPVGSMVGCIVVGSNVGVNVNNPEGYGEILGVVDGTFVEISDRLPRLDCLLFFLELFVPIFVVVGC